MSHPRNHSRNRATSQPPKRSGRHLRKRQKSSSSAAGAALTGAPFSSGPPDFDRPLRQRGHRPQHRRPSVCRPYVTTGIAIVGASAVVGSSITPPAARVETTRLELTVAESSAPMPNPLLAAVVETSTRSSCEAVDARVDGWCAGAFPSLFTPVAGVLGTGLDIWDRTVGLGASVVAGTAITAGLIGVGLDTALAEALLTPLEVLVEGGVLPAQLATSIAAMVGGFTTGVNIGIAGVTTGIAWKAALDAALANTIAAAGADIINALIAGFPNMDFPAAIAAVIGGLAAMGETALTWLDATVTLGASVVAGIAMTAATSVVELNTALTGAFLECLEALAESGVLPASAATALAGLVGSVSSAANAGILGLGSAVAWTAALPAVLTHAIATTGVGLIDGIAGLFPNVPDYPVIDVAALHALLEASFPNFPLLPPLDFADLEAARFSSVLKTVFPNFPDVELPDLEFPELDLAALIALLHSAIPNSHFPDSNVADAPDRHPGALIAQVHNNNADFPDLDTSAQLSIPLKTDVSVSSEGDEPELTEDLNVVQESPNQAFAKGPKIEPPSGPKHVLPDEPDEAALVRNASSTPPKHALNDTSKHDLHGVPEPGLKGSNTQSSETRASESFQSPDSSPQGSAATSQSGSDKTSDRQTNGTSDRGSNRSDSSE